MPELPNNSKNLQAEIRKQLDFLLEPFLGDDFRERCYPGLILQHGQRTMLQINVPATDLPNLLQARPTIGNNPDSGKDRPEIKGHADEIKRYIIERVSNGKPWTLGTLTANVAPERITVIELARGICIVVIPHGVKLDITDGQHRTKAIEQLLRTATAKLIINEAFPITVVLEDNFQQCKVDFHDLAQAKPVDKSLLLSFSQSSGRVSITKYLIEKVLMFRGKTDKINKSPSKKDKLIYTTNYIARAVSCVFTDNPEDELENYAVEQLSETLANCLNQFFLECCHTKPIVETSIEKLTLDEVNNFREECLLGVSVGLEILGRLLYCTYNQTNKYFSDSKVLQLAQLDWSRENSLWHNNVVRINSKVKNPTKTISWGASSIADAVKAAKTELGWM